MRRERGSCVDVLGKKVLGREVVSEKIFREVGFGIQRNIMEVSVFGLEGVINLVRKYGQRRMGVGIGIDDMEFGRLLKEYSILFQER